MFGVLVETTSILGPSVVDILWAIVALAHFALALIALRQLWRSKRGLSLSTAIVWVALIVWIPFVGAIASILLHRIGERRAAPAGASAQRAAPPE
jgi:drug/metabolite transporter (DMT)-like permease